MSNCLQCVWIATVLVTLALYRAPGVHELQLGVAFVVLWLPLCELAVAAHIPGSSVVLQIGLQKSFELAAQHWIINRCDGFNAPVEVAAHPIGTANEHLGLPAVAKPKDA